MDPQKFYEKMDQIRMQYKSDLEACHVEMDDLMCKVLNELGYEAGVRVFENTEKWYA